MISPVTTSTGWPSAMRLLGAELAELDARAAAPATGPAAGRAARPPAAGRRSGCGRRWPPPPAGARKRRRSQAPAAPRPRHCAEPAVAGDRRLDRQPASGGGGASSVNGSTNQRSPQLEQRTVAAGAAQRRRRDPELGVTAGAGDDHRVARRPAAGVLLFTVDIVLDCILLYDVECLSASEAARAAAIGPRTAPPSCSCSEVGDALRHRRRGAARHRPAPGGRQLPLPHRPQRRRQDLAPARCSAWPSRHPAAD